MLLGWVKLSHYSRYFLHSDCFFDVGTGKKVPFYEKGSVFKRAAENTAYY
jgi:hypothetical protein